MPETSLETLEDSRDERPSKLHCIIGNNRCNQDKLEEGKVERHKKPGKCVTGTREVDDESTDTDEAIEDVMKKKIH